MHRHFHPLGAFLALVLAALLQPAAAGADPSPRLLAEGLQKWLELAATNVLEAAREMPEADFAFRPTPEVRTFGEIVGHVADSLQGLCHLADGTPSEPTDWEKTATTKASLIAVLEGSTAECVALLGASDDVGLRRPVEFGRGPMASGAVYSFVTGHTSLHYGNLVTYLRIRGHVPPSSRN
jgi:uncharacterized damage-inducible protein DinB